MITYADFARAVLIAVAALCTGAVGVVLRLHWRAWVSATTRGGGLLPSHVWLVALAHEIYVVGVAIGMIDQLGVSGVTWRVWLYTAAEVLTLLALVQVARYQYRRVFIQGTASTTVVTEQITVTGDQNDTVAPTPGDTPAGGAHDPE